MNTNLTPGVPFSTDGWPIGRGAFGCTVIPFWRAAEGEWEWHHSAPSGWYRESLRSSGCGHAQALVWTPEKPDQATSHVTIDGERFGAAYEKVAGGVWIWRCHGQVQLADTVFELIEELRRDPENTDSPENDPRVRAVLARRPQGVRA